MPSRRDERRPHNRAEAGGLGSESNRDSESLIELEREVEKYRRTSDMRLRQRSRSPPKAHRRRSVSPVSTEVDDFFSDRGRRESRREKFEREGSRYIMTI